MNHIERRVAVIDLLVGDVELFVNQRAAVLQVNLVAFGLELANEFSVQRKS